MTQAQAEPRKSKAGRKPNPQTIERVIFSSRMKQEISDRLHIQAAVEKRKMYEIIEDATAAYLDEHWHKALPKGTKKKPEGDTVNRIIFSSRMKSEISDRLHIQAAVERRRMYEIIEDATVAYLAKHEKTHKK